MNSENVAKILKDWEQVLQSLDQLSHAELVAGAPRVLEAMEKQSHRRKANESSTERRLSAVFRKVLKGIERRLIESRSE